MRIGARPHGGWSSCHAVQWDLSAPPFGDRVVLDLSGVEYISSVGLRVLMLASKQAKAQGCALGVCGLQPVVREIFEISRFNLVLPVFPTLREALVLTFAVGVRLW